MNQPRRKQPKTAGNQLIQLADPIIGVKIQHLMFAIGVLEMVVALFCILSRRHLLTTLLVAWLATGFSAYRIGLWWINWKRPCDCLGNLMDVLHVSPQTADNVMKVVLAFLLIGSYASLFWFWKKGRKIVVTLST